MAIETEQQVILPNYGAPVWQSGPVKDAFALLANFGSRYGLLIAFAALWQIAPTLHWISPAVLPPLSAILVALWNGITVGTFAGDIAISLQRAGLAFGAAVALGIPLGLFMGQVRVIERSLDPRAVGDVALDGGAAEAFGHRLQRLEPSSEQREFGTGGVEVRGGSSANTGASAGDQGMASGKRQVWHLVPSCAWSIGRTAVRWQAGADEDRDP